MLHKVKTSFKFIVIMCDPSCYIFNPLFHSGKRILLQGRSFHFWSGIEQLRQLPLGCSLHLNCLLPSFVPSQSLDRLVNVVAKINILINYCTRPKIDNAFNIQQIYFICHLLGFVSFRIPIYPFIIKLAIWTFASLRVIY
jgi:hypothetical protein